MVEFTEFDFVLGLCSTIEESPLAKVLVLRQPFFHSALNHFNCIQFLHGRSLFSLVMFSGRVRAMARLGRQDVASSSFHSAHRRVGIGHQNVIHRFCVDVFHAELLGRPFRRACAPLTIQSCRLSRRQTFQMTDTFFSRCVDRGARQPSDYEPRGYTSAFRNTSCFRKSIALSD
jgi:hypothetical protein